MSYQQSAPLSSNYLSSFSHIDYPPCLSLTHIDKFLYFHLALTHFEEITVE